MSYPPPVYHGGAGEVTARFRPAGTAADLPRPHGGWHFLALGNDTDSRFGLFRYDIGPQRGDAPPPHFHRTFSESFFVLSGVLTCYDGAN